VILLVCSDLFSQFDPAESILFGGLGIWVFWIINFYIYFMLSLLPVFSFSLYRGVPGLIIWFLEGFEELRGKGVLQRFPGASSLLMSLLYLLIIVNIAGLFPATFSLSRQFLFRIALAIPLWFRRVLINFRKLPLVKIGWFIGTGVPVALASPIGVCEVIRMVMRPIALGLRLGANMLAGHVILSLVAGCTIFTWRSIIVLAFVVCFIFSFVLFLFEGFVCAIQAFVFAMLLRIYIGETPIG
jgi:ATP synthase subunit 6